jgi:hypothetical protein
VKNVLILGASGQIASWAIHMLACQTDVKMTLLVRNPSKLNGEEPVNSEIVIGDASDQAFMDQLMAGKDIVYANLAGEVDEQMKVIISAMKRITFNELSVLIPWVYTMKYRVNSASGITKPLVSISHLTENVQISLNVLGLITLSSEQPG